MTVESLTGEAADLYRSLRPGRRMTGTTKAVRALLLATDAQTFYNGVLWRIRSRSLGAGVY